MKNKHLFKKIVALICCITMCIPSFALSTSAADDSVTFDVKVSGDVAIYTPSLRKELKQGTVLTEAEQKSFGYDCSYGSDGTITFAGYDSALPGKSVKFSVKSELSPTVVVENDEYGDFGVEVATTPKLAKDVKYWEVTVNIGEYAETGVTLSVAPGEQKYNVTFPVSGKDYTVNVGGDRVTSANATASYTKDQELNVSIVLSDANKGKKDISVWSEAIGVITVDENGSFVYTVTADDTLTVDLETKTFSVSGIQNGTGYTCSATTPTTGIAYGGSCSFYVVPADGFSAPKVYANSEQIYPVDGNLYVVNNITENITIKVTAGSSKTYTVSLRSDVGSSAQLVGTKETFNHNENVEFKVSAYPGYEIVSVTATVGGADVTPTKTGDVYSVAATGNVIVNVASKESMYNVTYEYISGKGTEYNVAEGTARTKYGTYTFSVTPIFGYVAPKITVTQGEESTVLPTSSNDQYSIQVVADTKITIEAVGKNKYTVQLPVGADFAASFAANAVDADNKAEFGETVKFKVVPSTGYSVAVTATSNGAIALVSPVEGEEHTYSVQVAGDTIISATAQKESYEVTFENTESEAYTLNGSNTTVVFGDYYRFYVTPADGFSAPKVEYTVNGNTNTATPVNGTQYEIQIIGKTTITITDGTVNKYSLILPSSGTGFFATVEGDGKFAYGTKATFTVLPDTDNGYKIDSVRVVMNGETSVLPVTDDGVYTINKVTGEMTVTVTVSKIQCDVTFDTTDGGLGTAYTLSGNDVTLVEHGSNITFYVNPGVGYGTPKVFVNDEFVSPANGTQYSVKVTGKTTIRIESAKKNKYTVTLNPTVGVTYEYKELSVEHDGSFSFTLKLDDAYNKSNPKVAVNTVVITPNEAGVYTIEKVTANLIVTVSDVQKNTYNVTLGSGNGYTLTTSDYTQVAHDGTFRFKLSITDGFKESEDFAVKANNVDITDTKDEYGNYSVIVTDDTAITVNGIVPIIYTATVTAPNATVTRDGEGDTISYNGDYIFTVKANKGYRVSSVVVNNKPATLSGDKYYVNGVTSNLQITVETVENTLTINYVCDEDNHEHYESKTLNYSAINDDAVKALASCPIHKFKGWYVGTTEVTADYLKSLIETENSTVSITAEFKFAGEAELAKLITMHQTTVQFDTSNSKVTFETLCTTNVANNPCVAEYVTVVAFGTLITNNKDFSFKENADVKNELLASTSVTASGSLDKLNVSDATVLYFRATQEDMHLDEINGDSIVLRANTSNPQNFYAAGWIELKVGDNIRIIIISDKNVAFDGNAAQ